MGKRAAQRRMASESDDEDGAFAPSNRMTAGSEDDSSDENMEWLGCILFTRQTKKERERERKKRRKVKKRERERERERERDREGEREGERATDRKMNAESDGACFRLTVAPGGLMAATQGCQTGARPRRVPRLNRPQPSDLVPAPQERSPRRCTRARFTTKTSWPPGSNA